MNDKFDGLVRWSLSKLPSNSRWSLAATSSVSLSTTESIDFDGAGPKLQHVCLNENYGGGAQDGRQNSKGISKSYRKKSLLSRRRCVGKRSVRLCRSRALWWIGAVNRQQDRCVVVCQQKKWGGDEPHFRFTVVCSRAWPEKAKMLALTNRSICGQDPGWSWWLRLRLFRGLKVAPTSNRVRVSGASCWAIGTKVQNMTRHHQQQQHLHHYCPI